jgi:acylphosphatase
MDFPLQQLHAQIEGRVQGVGFRYFVQQSATRLGVTGWVRNRWNGTVEVVAEGDRTQLDQLVARLNRGPTGSLVQKVDVSWAEASQKFSRFRIRQTG